MYTVQKEFRIGYEQPSPVGSQFRFIPTTGIVKAYCDFYSRPRLIIFDPLFDFSHKTFQK